MGNVTIGDPLILNCSVTAVRGISSSVDIIWSTGGIVVRRMNNLTADTTNDSAIFIDLFEISSLSAIDNRRKYQCKVTINANQSISNSDQITLVFPGKCADSYIYIKKESGLFLVKLLPTEGYNIING